jgi:uncharacterized membrane protein
VRKDTLRGKNEPQIPPAQQLFEPCAANTLLPSAKELAQLKELDSGVMDWVKGHLDQEQSERHRDHRRRVELLEAQIHREFRLDRLAMLLAFTVIAIGMAFSACFVFMQQQVWGTVYAGVTIVAAASVFFRQRRRKIKSIPDDGKDDTS